MQTPRTAYVVRDRRAITLLLVGIGVALAVAILLAALTGSWASTVVTVAIIAYLAAVQLRAVRVRLRVDQYGVSVSDPEVRFRPGERRYVPWEAVRQIVVDGDLLVVAVRADAAMPLWMKARPTDAALPEGGAELRAAVPGLDPGALQQAVHDLGVGVPVLVR